MLLPEGGKAIIAGDNPCGEGEVLAYRRSTGHELDEKPCAKEQALLYEGRE